MIDLGQLIARLCFAGPVLYIGLVLTLDPAGFLRGLDALSQVLHGFQHRFRQPGWHHLTPARSASGAAPRAIRVFGVAVIAVTVLWLSGVAG